MTSFEEFARELRAFDGRREVVNEIRRELRKPLPELRTAVREGAVEILPKRGGLGAWVAKSLFSVQFRDAGRSAGIRIKVSRKNTKGKADIRSLDETGSLRHPLFGNRKKWYPQVVAARWFTETWEKFSDEWVKAADDALDKALEKIRG